MILLLSFHQFPVKMCSLDYLCQWWNRTYRLRSCKDDRNSKKTNLYAYKFVVFPQIFFFKEKWVWRFSHIIHILIRLIQVNWKNTNSAEWYRVKSQPLFPSLPPLLPKDDHHYYHFNIFLLIFLTDIQTQKYMHVYVPGATTGDPTHDKVHVEEDC